jgi:flagellar M-ring protein FliF
VQRISVQAFADFLRSLGPGRIIAMGAVTIALMGFFAYLMLRVTAPQMTPLFTDLSPEDSSSIIKDLERQGIPYELRQDGATILVAKDRVGRLRMKLAESGLPKGGGVGYEIFDKTDVLGATNFVQNINHLRALEGELARTIRALDRVQAARVHLVLPERPLFSREKAEPSASIVLRVRGQLEPQQVRAIRHLVASAVNGLKPQRVSVVDEAGRLLADGNTDGTSALGAQIDERRIAFERRLREQVEAIVNSVVGPGRSHVQLTAEFDFNRITQTSDKFDPEGRVVRSSQTREEISGAENREGPVSVGNELPGAAQPRAEGAAGRDQNRRTEEVVNYEISRTTKTEVIEGGRINRISVAVVVDGRYTKNDKGEPVYEPRSKEEIDRIAALVRSAIGYDAKRGDQVEVVNLRLAELPQTPISEPSGIMSYLQFTKDDIMRAVELLIMALLAVIVILMVVRPMLRRILTPVPTAAAGAAEEAAVTLTEPAPGAPQSATIPPSKTAKMIDIAQVQGQVHAQSVQRVGELADKHPNETVSIIRSWLHEEAA